MTNSELDNVKRVPRWKTKITVDITIATAVKNFLENYAEIHGLPQTTGYSTPGTYLEHLKFLNCTRDIPGVLCAEKGTIQRGFTLKFLHRVM